MNEYYHANGQVVAQKMFGLKGRISPSREETINTNGGLMFYEYDGLNSTIALRNRHGDKIEDYRYDVFGNIQTGITSPYNLSTYTGHMYDDKTSLVYMNARWYNPNIGKFMTKDTYRGDLLNPQSLNQYAYVLNNPVNYIDPTGHLAEYSSDQILGMLRPDVQAEIERMSDIWFEDEAIFKETGKWTEKQELAHQNAELMRALLPETYYLDDTVTTRGESREINKRDYIDSMLYTYERDITETQIYRNDYTTREESRTGKESYNVTVSAKEIALSNQEEIQGKVGRINISWNDEKKITHTITAEQRNIMIHGQAKVGTVKVVTTEIENNQNVSYIEKPDFWDKLDNIGTALMINDPIPNGSLPYMFDYIDNLTGLSVKLAGIGGKVAVKPVISSIVKYNNNVIKPALISAAKYLDDTAKYLDDALKGISSKIKGFGKAFFKNGDDMIDDIAKGAGSSGGIVTKNGIKIEGFTSHGVDRAIGDGFKRAGVKPDSILDALKNPLKTNDIVTDSLGRRSQRFIGKTAEVVINPDTGKIISVNPTSSSKAAKFLKELEGLK
jgi:RHS repeat-associated protein